MDTATPAAPLLLTPAQTQLALNVSRSTLAGLIATGELPSVKIGRSRRIPAAAVDEFVTRMLGKGSGGDEA